MWLVTLTLAGLVACNGELDPLGDEDNDGYTNGEETSMGSDPLDGADVPYMGGWVKDADCRFDVNPTGNDEGQVAEDMVVIDQFGEELRLHDFCGRVLLIESTAPT
jgi:hypothetical protein